MSEWEEAFDTASQRSYFYHRVTGETSWTAPGEATSETTAVNNNVESAWQQAFDDVSQTAYYYNLTTGETSWTLPVSSLLRQPSLDPPRNDDDDPTSDDLSYLVFAAVQLQSRYRGQRARRRIARLVRASYSVTRDAATDQLLFTHVRTNVTSPTKPVLFTTLSIRGDGDGSSSEEDGDDMDFAAFQAQIEQDEGGDDGDDIDDVDDDEDDAAATDNNKPPKRSPLRSKAQQCVDAIEDAQATGDESNSSTELDMSGLDLYRLSSRIWNLHCILRLVLSKNRLTRLPSGIQDLVHLTELNVSDNRLTCLPSCLQTTTTLTALNASHNHITTFAASLWKLRNLQRLDLSHNVLTELPFVEGDLKLLRETREWQVGIGLLTNLQSLMLNHNRLTTLPQSLDKCKALEFLNLSHNRMTVLNDAVGDLPALQCLYLQSNNLETLPESIGRLLRLEILEIKANCLTSVPSSLEALASLQQLGLANNALTYLPLELGALSRLSRLELDQNASFLTLSVLFRRLSMLRVFSASGCGLVRFESPSFLPDAPLQALTLSENALTAFPVELASAAMRQTLEELVLRCNRLTQFPVDVARNCHALRILDVSHNALRSLPSEVALLTQLETLDVSHNALERLPDAITHLVHLQTLDASDNRLCSLPLALGRLVRLTYVDVSSNALVTLPTSMTALAALTTLVARDNALVRPPPALVALRACRCDLTNNPFAVTWIEQQQQRTQALAVATRALAAAQFGDAETRYTALVATLDAQPRAVQQLQRPQLYYARGVCRYLLLKQARVDIAQTSVTISECERAMRQRALLHARQATKNALKHSQQQQQSNQHDDANSSRKASAAVEPHDNNDDDAGTTNNQNEAMDDNDSNYSSSTFARAASLRLQARQCAETLATGALADLHVAIDCSRLSLHSSAHELLPSAYFLQGRTHMTRLEFDPAIQSFTNALALLLVPHTDNNSGSDVSTATIPPIAVALFLQRAEAYRLLGQLPAALADVRCVLASDHDGSAAVASSANYAREELYAREWDAQQLEYFVDRVTLFRAMDVSYTSGLPRRPEVVDGRPALLPHTQRLRPAARFTADVTRHSVELQAVAAQAHARIDASLAAKRRALCRTRDFMREVRANLALEHEEAQQRAVESELARRAQFAAIDCDRAANERLSMQYEDELAQWLADEARRCEREQLQQLDQVQKQADARAAYATRLARRGGRRQPAAAAAATRRSSTSKKSSR